MLWFFKQGGSQCKNGFFDFQNVAINCCVVQQNATKFCKDKLYRGTVSLACFNAFIGQWAIFQWTTDTCPITGAVCGCQNCMTNSADLQCKQAGQALVMLRYASLTTSYCSLPNHTLDFDGGLEQNFTNQRNQYSIKSTVCNILAIKKPILKFLKPLPNLCSL
jgi:hypothetical protein